MTIHTTSMQAIHILYMYDRIRGDAKGVPLPNLIQQLQEMASRGEAYTFFADSEVIMVGGVIKGVGGVGTLWLVGTTDVPRHIKDLTAVLLRMREPMMDRLGLHRLQTDVLASHPSWVKWAQFFGMKEEGIMRQYTQSREDVVLMAYVRDN